MKLRNIITQSRGSFVFDGTIDISFCLWHEEYTTMTRRSTRGYNVELHIKGSRHVSPPTRTHSDSVFGLRTTSKKKPSCITCKRTGGKIVISAPKYSNTVCDTLCGWLRGTCTAEVGLVQRNAHTSNAMTHHFGY